MKIKSNVENEYVRRINLVLDYIENNIEKQFTLDELASVACFSKYHFNRIFRTAMRESPFQFITRIRIEKVATFLLMNPNEPISDIAFKYGFGDSSVFSRYFKNRFGISASQYRQEKNPNSNIGQINSNIMQIPEKETSYFCSFPDNNNWRTDVEIRQAVEVRELPEMTVAYMRYIGHYQGDSKLFEGLWNKMFAWAGPRQLIGGPNFNSLIIYHDDPNITAGDKLRTDICITVPADTKVDGEVGKAKIEKGQYAIGRFEVDETEFPKAWNAMYGEWLPTSGYQPDDKPCFEMYPEELKNGKFIIDICIPVKPL